MLTIVVEGRKAFVWCMTCQRYAPSYDRVTYRCEGCREAATKAELHKAHLVATVAS